MSWVIWPSWERQLVLQDANHRRYHLWPLSSVLVLSFPQILILTISASIQHLSAPGLLVSPFTPTDRFTVALFFSSWHWSFVMVENLSLVFVKFKCPRMEICKDIRVLVFKRDHNYHMYEQMWCQANIIFLSVTPHRAEKITFTNRYIVLQKENFNWQPWASRNAHSVCQVFDTLGVIYPTVADTGGKVESPGKEQYSNYV